MISGTSQFVGPGFGSTLVLAGISIFCKIIKYVYHILELLTESVFFSKKGAIAPFFPQKEDNGPLFEEHSPPFEEKRGERYKKGGRYIHTYVARPFQLVGPHS